MILGAGRRHGERSTAFSESAPGSVRSSTTQDTVFRYRSHLQGGDHSLRLVPALIGTRRSGMEPAVTASSLSSSSVTAFERGRSLREGRAVTPIHLISPTRLLPIRWVRFVTSISTRVTSKRMRSGNISRDNDSSGRAAADTALHCADCLSLRWVHGQYLS